MITRRIIVNLIVFFAMWSTTASVPGKSRVSRPLSVHLTLNGAVPSSPRASRISASRSGSPRW